MERYRRLSLMECSFLASSLTDSHRQGCARTCRGSCEGASLLRTEALPFRYFHDGGNLPHVGDGGFFDGHAVAFGAVVAHWPFGVHSRANFCASGI